MNLRIEAGSDEDRDPPEQLALVLSGFRNDLGRHRALAHLGQRIATLPDELSLPFTLFEEIDEEAGTRLCAELSALGAIVSLRRREDNDDRAGIPAMVATDSVPVYDGSTGSAAPAWRVSPLRIVRLLGTALRIPLLVFAGMALFWTFRLLQMRYGDVDFVHVPKPVRPRVAASQAVTPRPAVHVAGSQVATPRTPNGHIKSLIAQGDTAGALRAIEDALAVGEEAAVVALQGDVYVKMSNWEGARAAYERAIALDSEDGQVFMALAAIYRQQGRQSAAVDMLHRAKEHGAGGSEFEALVDVVKTEQDAESDFDSAASPHFTISFDEGEDDATAQLILSQLEDAYLNVGHKLGYYPNHRTPVVLYAARDFQRVTHSPGWAAALYDGRIKVPVRGVRGNTPDLAGTLRHEYAHALINSIAGERCPVWLHEGVAMWAEEARDGEREGWALAARRVGRPVSLTELERSFIHLSGQQAIAAYAQSYLAVRHIVARYGQLSLQKLLEAFASRASTADAFREALSIELSTFEDELRFDQDEVG